MKKIIWIILLLVILIGAYYFYTNELIAPTVDMTIFKDKDLQFSYPASWTGIEKLPANKTCPEEDTYRTPDTLNIFDNEYRFKDFQLKDSKSFIRIGIRTYLTNVINKSECNNELLIKLAKKEIIGEVLSSIQLSSVNINNLFGVHNKRASRLNTESREQYALFFKKSDDLVLIVQPYLSFVPYADSREWMEIEENYKDDISSYVSSGKTSAEIRKYLADFRKMAESIEINQNKFSNQ